MCLVPPDLRKVRSELAPTPASPCTFCVGFVQRCCDPLARVAVGAVRVFAPAARVVGFAARPLTPNGGGLWETGTAKTRWYKYLTLENIHKNAWGMHMFARINLCVFASLHGNLHM